MEADGHSDGETETHMMKQTEQDATCSIIRVNGYMRSDRTIQLFYTFEVFHTKISEENDYW